jgi:hypothetical protein
VSRNRPHQRPVRRVATRRERSPDRYHDRNSALDRQKDEARGNETTTDRTRSPRHRRAAAPWKRSHSPSARHTRRPQHPNTCKIFSYVSRTLISLGKWRRGQIHAKLLFPVAGTQQHTPRRPMSSRLFTSEYPYRGVVIIASAASVDLCRNYFKTCRWKQNSFSPAGM